MSSSVGHVESDRLYVAFVFQGEEDSVSDLSILQYSSSKSSRVNRFRQRVVA